MKLYEIHDELERVLSQHTDHETGEIGDDALALLESLEMQRDEKSLAVAAYLKGERAEADAIQNEADRLSDRAGIHYRRAARLEAYLAAYVPQGQKLSDARSVISWRRSKAVEVDVAPENLPPQYQRVKVTADKIELRRALDAGEEVKGARLVERWSLGVK